MLLFRIFSKWFPLIILILATLSVCSKEFSPRLNSQSSNLNPNQENIMIRQFLNDQLNSRADINLPKGVWEIKWKIPLAKGLNPNLILATDDRVLVCGSKAWQLFDLSGNMILINKYSNSDITIDTQKSLIYCADENSMLVAYNISDGKINFILDEIYGVNYRRAFITRNNNLLLVLSNEQKLDPHSVDDPEDSYIQTQIMNERVSVDNLQILTNSKKGKIEMIESAEVMALANDNYFVITYPDHVEFLDSELNRVKTFNEKFTPLAFSLDENNFVYLVVRTINDKNALWVINSDMEKFFELDLPDSENYQPPCIGFDGTVYINLGNQILAIRTDTGQLWNQYTHHVSGLTALSDNNLLLAEANFILVFNTEGERRLVFEFPEGTHLTMPFINNNGEIFVADKSNLYSLQITK